MDEIFDEHTFYRQFSTDIRRAQALVLIHSPFLGWRRIDKLERLLELCVSRRVCVCVFVQTPTNSEKLEATVKHIERLKSLGVHVTLRDNIHEKLAVIDERILWEGSLNILSQVHSSERMLRWESRQRVFEAIVRHKLNCCETCLQANQRLDILPETCTANDQLKVIGAVVSRRRKLLRISQNDLATMSGVSRTTVSRVETGSRAMQLESLVRLCSALNLELRAVPWYFLPSLDLPFNHP